MPGSVLSVLHVLSSLILTGLLRGYHYMGFTDEVLRRVNTRWGRGRFRPELLDS